MSWLRDVDGDLVNLDLCEKVYIAQFESSDDWGVFASSLKGEEPQHILAIADEDACRRKLDAIASKLPMVRI